MLCQEIITSYIDTSVGTGLVYANSIGELKQVVADFNRNKAQRMIMLGTPKLLPALVNPEFGVLNFIKNKDWGLVRANRAMFKSQLC